MEVETESSLSASGLPSPPSSSLAETATKPKMELPPPLRASELQPPGPEKKLYWDRSHYSSPEAQMRALTKSSCLYVGNLSFSCRTMHVREHFEQLGPVKEVIMGLDRNKKTPCGFCFVEYYDRRIALQAVSLLTGTKLDGSIIRVELDAGFKSGREYGRGVRGGQVRDDRGHKRNRAGVLHNAAAGTSGTTAATTAAAWTPEVKMDAALPSARDVSSGQFFGRSSSSTSGPPVPKMEINEDDTMIMDQQHENAEDLHDNVRDNDDDDARPGVKRQKTEE